MNELFNSKEIVPCRWDRYCTNARIHSAVAIGGVPDAQHAFLIQLVFLALDQQNVVLHPIDFRSDGARARIKRSTEKEMR